MRSHAAPARTPLQSLMRPISLLLATLLAVSTVAFGASPAAADHGGPHFGPVTTATVIVGEDANITDFMPTGGTNTQVWLGAGEWRAYLEMAADGRITGIPHDGHQGHVFTSNVHASDDQGRTDQTQITVTIKARAKFGNDASSTFTEGTWADFGIHAYDGFPTPVLSVDALPAGLILEDLGNGEGRISGTPAAGTVGTHNFTITARGDDDVSSTQNFTLTIDQPTFTSVSSPVIDGDAKVGNQLTALSEPTDPEAASVAYTWLRDGDPVHNGPTYDVVAGDLGATFIVRATHTRTGYDDAVATSAPVTIANGTFENPIVTVAGRAAIAETLVADVAAIDPAIEDLTYQWLTDGQPIADAVADRYVVLSGDENARLSVRVTASADGYDPASVTSEETAPVVGLEEVALPAKALNVSVAKPTGLRGRWAQVRVRGLAEDEAYTMSVGGMKVRGVAPGGVVTRFVRLKPTMTLGRKVVAVTGAHTDRVGRSSLVLVAAKRLNLAPASRHVRAGTFTTVRVSGLVANEQVTVRHRGRVVTPKTARANVAGVYIARFSVGGGPGKGLLVVKGSFPRRHGQAPLRVTPAR